MAKSKQGSPAAHRAQAAHPRGDARRECGRRADRPLLGSICFRPEDPEGATARTARRASCASIASNGHKLVSMIGGTWKGTWHHRAASRGDPADAVQLASVPGSCWSTTVTVQALDDGGVTVFDNAADHQAAGCDVGSCFLRYPDVDGILKRYRRYAIARKAVGLNASYLEEMGRIGEVFQDHAFNRLLRDAATGAT